MPRCALVTGVDVRSMVEMDHGTSLPSQGHQATGADFGPDFGKPSVPCASSLRFDVTAPQGQLLVRVVGIRAVLSVRDDGRLLLMIFAGGRWPRSRVAEKADGDKVCVKRHGLGFES